METKHTKSTWVYNHDMEAVVTIKDHQVKTIADFGKTDIAESVYNAKLIAAAPDLLDACQRALEVGLLDDLSTHILRDAIKKATE